MYHKFCGFWRKSDWKQPLKTRGHIGSSYSPSPLSTIESTRCSLKILSLIIPGLHRETDPADIPKQLKVSSVANFVTKKDKALHLEIPTLPIKSRSRLFVVTFEPAQEVIQGLKIT